MTYEINWEEEYKKLNKRFVIYQKAMFKIYRDNQNWYGEIVGPSGQTAYDVLKQTGDLIEIDKDGQREP